MATDALRVLLVDDDADILRQLTEHLQALNLGGDKFQCDTKQRFDDAIPEIQNRKFDLLVLDVFQGDAGQNIQRGREVLTQLKSLQFLPVIFYTALPQRVEDLASPVVKVVTKSATGSKDVSDGIAGFRDAGLLRLNKVFLEHVDRTLREYLWDFVPKHWEELFGKGDPTTLGYVLCRRLAASLNSRRAEELGREMGGATEGVRDEALAHPMQLYIIPTSERSFLVGDIVERVDDRSRWIVITPSCDFAQNKAEYVLLCRCIPLTEFKEYQDYVNADPVVNEIVSQDQKAREQPKKNQPGTDPDAKLRDLISNRGQKRQQDRYWFLPGVLDMPDCIIDHQQTLSVELKALEDAKKFLKLASLDSPFRDGITQKFSRFMGRIGFPDLDTKLVLTTLAERRDTDRRLKTSGAKAAASEGETRVTVEPEVRTDVATSGPVTQPTTELHARVEPSPAPRDDEK